MRIPASKGKVLIALAFAIPIALLAVLGLVALLLTTSFFTNRPSTIESQRPLSLVEAKQCPIPLPKSAHDIQYAAYADWQILDCYVRFEASPQDCLAEAKALLAQDEKTGSRIPESDRTFRPAVTVPSPSSRYFKDLSWFDIGQLLEKPRCLEIGGDNDIEPHIWIDQDRGVFYYHMWH
jgi:hypothetical protein